MMFIFVILVYNILSKLSIAYLTICQKNSDNSLPLPTKDTVFHLTLYIYGDPYQKSGVGVNFLKKIFST